MTWMSALREKLSGHRRDVFREAIDATEAVTVQTRSIRQQLEPYRLEDDPFASLVRKRLMVETFESVQESEIFRGPP